MKEPKAIYCPICKSKVGTYDGRSSINVITRCRKCKKQVIYFVDTEETKVKSLPKRATSSGITF
jgi:hypothetical protein